MNMNRQQLLDILKAVQPGLAAKEALEQSKSFVFMDGEVLTYNDEVSISHPIDLDLQGAVAADGLFELLGRLKTDEIELVAADGELHVKAGKVKAGIPMVEEVTLPINEEIILPEKWKKLPTNFVEALKFASFSASDDMSREVLNCVHVKGKVVESCDDFRLTQVDLVKSIGKTSLLLPVATVRLLVTYNPTHWEVSEGWAHFTNKDEVVFSCRVLEDEYPDLTKLLQVDGDKVEFGDDLMEAVSHASIFSETEFKQDEQVIVTLTPKKGGVVEGRGTRGWLTERIKCAYSGPELAFAAHPDFLVDALRMLQDVTVSEDRLRLDGEGWVHVVTLMALGDD